MVKDFLKLCTFKHISVFFKKYVINLIFLYCLKLKKKKNEEEEEEEQKEKEKEGKKNLFIFITTFLK